MTVEQIQDILDTYDPDVLVAISVSDGLRNITKPIADIVYENGMLIIKSI